MFVGSLRARFLQLLRAPFIHDLLCSFKLDDLEKNFAIDLSYQLCYKGLCADRQTVLQNVLVGKPLCNADITKSLPGKRFRR